MEEREGSRERTKSGNAGERKRGKRERERERERRKKNRCIEALTNYPGARREEPYQDTDTERDRHRDRHRDRLIIPVRGVRSSAERRLQTHSIENTFYREHIL